MCLRPCFGRCGEWVRGRGSGENCRRCLFPPPPSERRWKNRRERGRRKRGTKNNTSPPVCTLASCVLWIQDLELDREVSTEARTAANLNSSTASLLSPTYVRYLASNSRPPQCQISRDVLKHLHRAASYSTPLHCRYIRTAGKSTFFFIHGFLFVLFSPEETRNLMRENDNIWSA